MRPFIEWIFESPNGKQTDKLGDLYFLEESYKKNVNSPSVAPLIRSPTLGREAQKG